MTRTKKIVNDTMVVKEDTPLSFTEWVSEKYHAAFIGNIPMESLKELPPSYTIWLGYIAYFIWIASLVFYFFQGYNSATTQEYMSLDSSSGNCDPVPTEITNTFLADDYGHWESASQFRASLAGYELKLQNIYLSNEEYRRGMSVIKDAIDRVAAGATSRDLYQNLLYWMMWEFALPNSVSKFYFKSDINTVFNRPYHYATFASSWGSCPEVPSTSYDINSYTYRISYNYENYMAHECNYIIDPVKMGYFGISDTRFTIAIDLRTYFIASAINNGVLSPSVLEIIESTRDIEYFPDGSVMFEVGMFFHARFPNHTPVFCGTFYNDYNRPNGTFLCALEYGNRYAVPVMNHAGINGNMCNCSTLINSGISLCQQHDALLGLLLFNEGDGFTEMSKVASQYPEPFQLDRLAFNASYSAVVTEVINPSAYDFCDYDGLRCSLVVLRLLGGNQQISDLYYTLTTGACTDTFTNAHWTSLEDTYPTKLQEDYYTCTQFWYDAALDSLGVAAGNTAITVPVLMMTLLPIVYLYLQHSNNKPMKKEYEEEELEAAASALSLMILRIRDGKTRDTVANGVLRKLTNELVMSAKVEGGYPDSDDDEEEDDGSNSKPTSATDENSDSIKNFQNKRTSVFLKESTRRKSTTNALKQRKGESVKSAMHGGEISDNNL